MNVLKKFDLNKIKEIIPHREPFLFLDEIIFLEPGKKVIAKKTITNEEFWVKGHFPNFAVCPGVISIEMLAQAGAVCILAVPENKGKIALFGGIDKARFKRQIFPGEEVLLTVDIIKQVGAIGIGKAVAKVGEEIAVLAQITFAVKN